MCGPNGIAFLSGGKRLVVAETHACRLTIFDVAPDGSLSNRRLFADLGDHHPDGICADRNGDIWVAGLYAATFLLVRDGGDILETIATPGRWAVACALGGPAGRRLFCATASQERPEDFRLGQTRSAIGYVDVDIPAS
jgi:sugar lactone lactonase YvrE